MAPQNLQPVVKGARGSGFGTNIFKEYTPLFADFSPAHLENNSQSCSYPPSNLCFHPPYFSNSALRCTTALVSIPLCSGGCGKYLVLPPGWYCRDCRQTGATIAPLAQTGRSDGLGSRRYRRPDRRSIRWRICWQHCCVGSRRPRHSCAPGSTTGSSWVDTRAWIWGSVCSNRVHRGLQRGALVPDDKELPGGEMLCHDAPNGSDEEVSARLYVGMMMVTRGGSETFSGTTWNL